MDPMPNAMISVCVLSRRLRAASAGAYADVAGPSVKTTRTLGTTTWPLFEFGGVIPLAGVTIEFSMSSSPIDVSVAPPE